MGQGTVTLSTITDATRSTTDKGALYVYQEKEDGSACDPILCYMVERPDGYAAVPFDQSAAFSTLRVRLQLPFYRRTRETSLSVSEIALQSGSLWGEQQMDMAPSQTTTGSRQWTLS